MFQLKTQGGRSYDFEGEVIIETSRKVSISVDYLLARIEHSVSTRTLDEGTNKVVLDCQDKRINVGSTIMGEDVRFVVIVFAQEFEVSIPNLAVTTDSYDGISASANYFIILEVVCASSTFRFSTCFKVRNPMPVRFLIEDLNVASPNFDGFNFMLRSL